jgi:hypothetical protein
MNKNIKKVLLLVFVLVLLFLAYLLISISYQEKTKKVPASGTQTDQNSEQTVNNQETSSTTANFVPEMMTEAEKIEMKLSPQLNLQVISRDADGKVEAYKIIRAESDIINPNQ